MKKNPPVVLEQVVALKNVSYLRFVLFVDTFEVVDAMDGTAGRFSKLVMSGLKPYI